MFSWCQFISILFLLKNNFFYNLIDTNQYIWLGASDVNHNNTFYWLTGDIVTFNDWRYGKPDGFIPGTNGKCVAAMVSIYVSWKICLPRDSVCVWFCFGMALKNFCLWNKEPKNTYTPKSQSRFHWRITWQNYCLQDYMHCINTP